MSASDKVDQRSKRETRRRLLKSAAGGLLLPSAILSAPAWSQEALSLTDPAETIVPALKDFTRGAAVQRGRVKLDIPRLAENGHLVPLKVSVESPMSATDYVRMLYLLSEKNPRPVIARIMLDQHAGKAELVTRVRLATTQRVVAVAEMFDGSFWSDVTEVIVTETACLDAT